MFDIDLSGKVIKLVGLDPFQRIAADFGNGMDFGDVDAVCFSKLLQLQSGEHLFGQNRFDALPDLRRIGFLLDPLAEALFIG